MNHVVECNEVSRVYDQDSVPVTALDGVDLTIGRDMHQGQSHTRSTSRIDSINIKTQKINNQCRLILSASQPIGSGEVPGKFRDVPRTFRGGSG